MRIDFTITWLDVWHVARIFLLLFGGLVGMAIFDVSTDGIEVDDHSQIGMVIGLAINLVCFGIFGAIIGKDD